MEKRFVVYAHIFPNGKIYIGIKKKISEAKKGRSPKPNAGLFGSKHPSAKRILALNRTTDEPVKMFGSIVDASKELNISKSCIQAALHGQQKSAAGYRWVYA